MKYLLIACVFLVGCGESKTDKMNRYAKTLEYCNKRMSVSTDSSAKAFSDMLPFFVDSLANPDNINSVRRQDSARAIYVKWEDSFDYYGHVFDSTLRDFYN